MVQMYQTKDFQGFWICNKDDSYNKKAVDGFLERTEDKKNLDCFIAELKKFCELKEAHQLRLCAEDH